MQFLIVCLKHIILTVVVAISPLVLEVAGGVLIGATTVFHKMGFGSAIQFQVETIFCGVVPPQATYVLEVEHMIEQCRFYLLFLVFAVLQNCVVAQPDVYKQPLEAVIRTLEWTTVFQSPHDLVVIYNSGYDTSRGSQGVFREEFLKMRQMHRETDGAFIVAQCVADSQVFALHADKEPVLTETINLSVSHGDRNHGEVLLLNGGSSGIRPREGRSTLEVACPIDFSALSCHIYNFNRKVSGPGSEESFQKLLNALESLEPKHVAHEDGSMGGKRVSIFRIVYPSRPDPTMREHEVYKMIVSQEGFDRGRIVEFSNNLVLYSANLRYESDSQLTHDAATTCTITWSEFDTNRSLSTSESISNESRTKLVLPVSITKKYKSNSTKKFVNVSLDWRGFDLEKLMSLNDAKRHCEDYRKDAERAMKR